MPADTAVYIYHIRTLDNLFAQVVGEAQAIKEESRRGKLVPFAHGVTNALGEAATSIEKARQLLADRAGELLIEKALKG